MRTIYARTEPTHILQPWEQIIGSSETTDLMTQWYIGEVMPESSIAAIRRSLLASLITALVPPPWPRKSDHDAWMWRGPDERRSRRVRRLTHAGRARKRGRL